MSDPIPLLSAVIQEDSFVTLHYKVTVINIDGKADHDFLSTFTEKPATLQLGAGQLASFLERKLLGLAQGSHHIFDFPAGVAYGEHNPELLQQVARKLFDPESRADRDFKPGDIIEFSAPGKGSYAGVLKELNTTGALFDFNHPLAGHRIRFEVKVIGVL